MKIRKDVNSERRLFIWQNLKDTLPDEEMASAETLKNRLVKHSDLSPRMAVEVIVALADTNKLWRKQNGISKELV